MGMQAVLLAFSSYSGSHTWLFGSQSYLSGVNFQPKAQIKPLITQMPSSFGSY